MLEPSPQLDWLEAPAPDQGYTLRRSARVRRLSLRVHRDARVEVVAPLRFPATLIHDFVARHRAWIDTRRERALRLRPLPQPFPPPAIALPAFGEHWRLHLAAGRGRLRVRPAVSGLLEVIGNAADAVALQRALLAWLMRHSRERLGAELDAVATEHGFRYANLSLRRQRTRWGSCSTRGTISLNVCLAFQPVDVMRYLLVHELAHTRHMNHSRAFWACVGQACPDWQRLDRALLDGWRSVPQWVIEAPRVPA
jgi:predicted metal-dependent hydrolase